MRLYQAVTLGAERFPVDEHGALVKGNFRHPIVEDDVVIYAGATILGQHHDRTRLDNRRQRLADAQRAPRQHRFTGTGAPRSV